VGIRCANHMPLRYIFAGRHCIHDTTELSELRNIKRTFKPREKRRRQTCLGTRIWNMDFSEPRHSFLRKHFSSGHVLRRAVSETRRRTFVSGCSHARDYCRPCLCLGVNPQYATDLLCAERQALGQRQNASRPSVTQAFREF
jgi:hypothetical protein